MDNADQLFLHGRSIAVPLEGKETSGMFRRSKRAIAPAGHRRPSWLAAAANHGGPDRKPGQCNPAHGRGRNRFGARGNNVLQERALLTVHTARPSWLRFPVFIKGRHRQNTLQETVT